MHIMCIWVYLNVCLEMPFILPEFWCNKSHTNDGWTTSWTCKCHLQQIHARLIYSYSYYKYWHTAMITTTAATNCIYLYEANPEIMLHVPCSTFFPHCHYIACGSKVVNIMVLFFVSLVVFNEESNLLGVRTFCVHSTDILFKTWDITTWWHYCTKKELFIVLNYFVVVADIWLFILW